MVDLVLEDIRSRLKADPAIRARLVAALEMVSMNGEGYVSQTDAISLRNWLSEIYELPVAAFEAVPISWLKKMGEEMLEESRESG